MTMEYTNHIIKLGENLLDLRSLALGFGPEKLRDQG